MLSNFPLAWYSTESSNFDTVSILAFKLIGPPKICLTGSQMELLRHLCVPHSDLERLRVIDERLRLISEENQSDFQVSHLWVSSSH